MKLPSKERGCDGKINLGRKYKIGADKLALKYKKKFGVYSCPYCEGFHITTKLEKKDNYSIPLIYTTA